MSFAMNRTIAVLLLSAMTLCVTRSAAQDGHPIHQVLANFGSQPWATIADGGGGYELRLLNDDEKDFAAETNKRYRGLRITSARTTSDQAKVIAAYRELPEDVRSNRFFRVKRSLGNGIELVNDDFRAIVPVDSIASISFGISGELVPDPTSASRSLSRSYPAGMRGGSAYPAGMRGGSALGSTMSGRSQTKESSESRVPKPTRSDNGNTKSPPKANAPKETAPKETEQQIAVLYLKYSRAGEVAENIAAILDDSKLRIAIDQRTNAMIVRGDRKVFEKVADLVEALDKEASPAQPAEGDDEMLTLKTYRIENADPRSVLEVLQTLMAGTPDLRMSFDGTSEKIIAYGRENDHQAIESAIKVLTEDD